MSYLVLARQYRPRNFTEMVGQPHVVQALGNALQTQRLHHAYLFTGTRGVGKTTISRILAKSLNCVGVDGSGTITNEPCGVCQACCDIDSGRFIDYIELDAASNRGVDEVQSLLEQAVYKPVQGRFKVFMIDEVHMLTNTAFNAMLKTLEEPPAYLKFVLATTDPQKVPVTVLSRCLQFNLRPMAPETILEHLTHVLNLEKIPFETGALRLLSRGARGSMRDALSLTDQAIAFGQGNLQETSVRQMLGSADQQHVFTLIDALALGDGLRIVQMSDFLRQEGFSAASVLEEMAVILQKMAVCQAVPQMALQMQKDSSDSDAQEVARLAMLMPADETQLLYSICLQGRAELGLSPDEFAGLTMILLRLLAFKPESDLAKSALVSSEKKNLKTNQTESSATALVANSQSPVSDSRSNDVNRLVNQGQVASQTIANQSPNPNVHDDLNHINNQEIDQQNNLHHHINNDQNPNQNKEINETKSIEENQNQQDLNAFWHETVQKLIAEGLISALVGQLALQSQLILREISESPKSEHWHLRIDNDSLNKPDTRETLRQVLETAQLANQLSVESGATTDNPAKRNKIAQEQRFQAAKQLVENDPIVQILKRDFDARILPNSIQIMNN